MAIIKKFRITSFKHEKSFISLENISVAFKKNHQILDSLTEYAINYFKDKVEPNKNSNNQMKKKKKN